MYMGVSDVRQPGIQAAEPPMAESSTFNVEMASEKLEKHKSPGTD
jgi:hypothetical protein